MKISIVTPSFNQAIHLEQTISSVQLSALSCGADLEYVVIDGGSTDGSCEIIERQSPHLAYWCSEKDGGQYDAINKGFAKTSGDIMGWLNSSDIYLPWTLETVREIFDKYPEASWITSLRKLCINFNGGIDGIQKMPGFAGRCFYAGVHGGPNNNNFIQQETVFWRRGLWEQIGSRIPDRCKYAADFHLWGEFFRHSPVYGVDAPLAGFRMHEHSRSSNAEYRKEVKMLLNEWSNNNYYKTAKNGYIVINKQWNKNQSEWIMHRISGNELIWALNYTNIDFETIEENIEYKWLLHISHIIQKEFYFLLKLFYKIARMFIWSLRGKSYNDENYH